MTKLQSIRIRISIFCLAMLCANYAMAYSHYYYYADVEAFVGEGEGEIFVSTTPTATPAYSTEPSRQENSLGTISPSGLYKGNEGDMNIPFYLYARPSEGYKFLGWSESPVRPSIYLSTSEQYIDTVRTASIGHYDSYEQLDGEPANCAWDYQVTNDQLNVYFRYSRHYDIYSYFAPRKAHFSATFHPTDMGGSYTVNGVEPTTLDSEEGSDVILAEVSAAAQAGYEFFGWYTLDDEGEHIYLGHEAQMTLRLTDDIEVYADFIEDTHAPLFELNLARDYDLHRIIRRAERQHGGTIILVRDGVLADGDYRLPAGVQLLIPSSALHNQQGSKPSVQTGGFTSLSQYRTLTLTDGVQLTIEQGASLCIGGTQLSAPSGQPSGGPVGTCGAIDMRHGGHIDNYGDLYCWGFILGQNMTEGNNTHNVGTITTYDGGNVWEDFVIGDWRGGAMSKELGDKNAQYRIFPFCSYFVQNIEVPVTYQYGGQERCMVSLYTASATTHIETIMTLIGSNNALFALRNSASSVTKWYDATTDHVHVSMQGTAELSHLQLNIAGTDVDSRKFFLPVPSNMYLHFEQCDFTLSNDVNILPGAVLEIGQGSRVNVGGKVVVYDAEQWGTFANNRYFYTLDNTLTPHYRRNGQSQAGLEDGRIVINGELTVGSKGALYTTASGAAITSANNGRYSMNRSTPEPYVVYQYLGNDWGETGVGLTPLTVRAADLCSDNGAYTRVNPYTQYRTIHRRWFTHTAAEDINADHTYRFTFLTEERDTVCHSAYTVDAAQRGWWTNIVEENTGYADTYRGLDGRLYNHTTLGQWLAIAPTAEEGIYVGSNNALYGYDADSDRWSSVGSSDTQCLYDIAGEKKALIDGAFITLLQNEEDEAWHSTTTPAQYYLRMEGCDWLPASPVDGQAQAYRSGEQVYIWYQFGWMSVEETDGIYYAYDEQHRHIGYRYDAAQQAWVPTEPCIRIRTATQTMEFWDAAQALSVAAQQANATITLLSDLSLRQSIRIATGISGNTTTLDLNGHQWRTTKGTALTLAPETKTCVFIITDHSANATGGIVVAGSSATPVTVEKGALRIEGGSFSHDAGLTPYLADGKALQPLSEGELYNKGYRYSVQNSGSTYHTVRFLLPDGSVLHSYSVEDGTMPFCEAPTLPASQQQNYLFRDWTPALHAAIEDEDYTALIDTVARTYTITFVNIDNTLLHSENLHYGETPTAPEAGYTAEDGYSYTFRTWMPNLRSVNRDQTYRAAYDRTANTYTIRFYDSDQTLLSESEWNYGAMPSCSHTFSDESLFAGWAPQLEPVSHSEDYVAIYYVANENGDHAYHLSNDETAYYIYREGWIAVVPDTIEVMRARYPYINAHTPETVYYYEDGEWRENGVLYACEGIHVEVPRDATVDEVRIELGGLIEVGSLESATLTTRKLIMQTNGLNAGQLDIKSHNSKIQITEQAILEYVISQPQSMRWYEIGAPFKVGINSITDEHGDTLYFDQDYDIELYDAVALSKDRNNFSALWKEYEGGTGVMAVQQAFRIRFHEGIAPERIDFYMQGETLPRTLIFDNYGKYTVNYNICRYKVQHTGWNAIVNSGLCQVNLSNAAEYTPLCMGQIYHSESESYELVSLHAALPMGSIVHMQATTASKTKYFTTAIDQPLFTAETERALATDEYLFTLGKVADAGASMTILRTLATAHSNYTVGEDMVKMGVSTIAPQLWIAQYNSELCVHTTTIPTTEQNIPLGLYAPDTCRYVLHAQRLAEESGLYLYLQCADSLIAALTEDVTLYLETGTHTEYSLVLSTTERTDIHPQTLPEEKEEGGEEEGSEEGGEGGEGGGEGEGGEGEGGEGEGGEGEGGEGEGGEGEGGEEGGEGGDITTGLQNSDNSRQAEKILRDGQLILRYRGREYTILGI